MAIASALKLCVDPRYKRLVCNPETGLPCIVLFFLFCVFYHRNADKESWEGCHGQRFFYFIFIVLFLIIYGTYLLCAGHRGGSVSFNRSLRYAHRPTTFGRFAIFGIMLWTERTCMASSDSGGNYPRSRLCLYALDASQMSSIVTGV